MKRTLSKIIGYAAGVAEPERIILFGSMACGNANVFSDIDLLIISENTLPKRETAAIITSYARELSLKVDVLIYSASEVEKERQKAHSFVGAILKSGKPVFENKRVLTS